MTTASAAAAFLAAAALIAEAYGSEEFSPAETRLIASLALPLAAQTSREPDLVLLGRHLFNEVSLSPTGTSCATCHIPHKGWSDDKLARQGARRTISLENVASNRWYFWDGREASLGAAALAPLTSPEEVGATPDSAGGTLSKEPYRTIVARLERTCTASPFLKCKQLKSSEDARLLLVADALSAFMETIRTKETPFDRFARSLQGHSFAEPSYPFSAQRGLKLFIGKAQCVTCHNTPAFSDGEFHNLRLLDPDGTIPTDPGRYIGIKLLRDNAKRDLFRKHDSPSAKIIPFLYPAGAHFSQFKTPGLRNVAKRHGFMHKAHFTTLREVVNYYSTFENSYPGHGAHDLLLQPLHLSENEIDSLLAFLETLSD